MTSFIYVFAILLAFSLIIFLLVATAALFSIARSIEKKTTSIKKLAEAVSRIADAIAGEYSDKS